jgi:hypothetical protein
MPAACGAAALVPKKFGWVSGSRIESATKNVVLPPSVAATSGLRRMSGRAKRLPAESNRIGSSPPAEVKSSGSSGRNGSYAATEVAPRALLWPNVAGASWLTYSVFCSPSNIA